MNLKSQIHEELWASLSRTYDAGNYSHAVIDAIHYLSDFLRDKSGVDGDGANLVGQALGGKSPKLKVNKLQTETERDVQKGLEQLLRGLYLGIRNPRSHEQVDDKQEDADAIIIFINYLLSVLEESEEPFTITKFKSRVFDPDFVESDRYAQLLVAEIPENKRFDTLVEIYRDKSQGDGTKLKYITDAILQRFSNEQMDEFFSIVSEDLQTERDTKSIITVLQIIDPTLWNRIEESSRIRIENMVIKSIQEGEMDRTSSTKTYKGKGVLGTWGNDYFPLFTLSEELRNTFINKLRRANQHERRYISKFYLGTFPKIFISENERKNCISAISWAVNQGGRNFIENVFYYFGSFPENWQREIWKSLQGEPDSDVLAVYLPDGTTFLDKYIAYDDVENDDIPF